MNTKDKPTAENTPLAATTEEEATMNRKIRADVAFVLILVVVWFLASL